MYSRRNCWKARAALRIVVLAAMVQMMVAPANAGEKKPPYAVQVLAIRATKSNKVVSPELKSIAKELQRQTGYTGFKLEKKSVGKVAEGKPHSASLVSGYSAKVTPLGREKSRVKLKAEIFRREGNKNVRKVGTTVSISRGRFWMHNLAYGGGTTDRLIIAVSAR